MSTFGKRLKELRIEKKLTQKDFANFFKLGESTISMYERDEREPSFELVRKFADFLNVPTDYLLGRTNDRRTSDQYTIDFDTKKLYLASKSDADSANKQFTNGEDLDSWGLSEEDMVFFKDFATLSEEDKQKAIEHIKFLKHLAEQKNREEK